MPTVSVKKLNPNGSVSPSNAVVEQVEKDVSLWESLDNKGYKLPSGCLNGNCAACRVEVIQGDNSLAPMGPNEQGTVDRYRKNMQGKPEGERIEGKTIRLSCQAKVVGDDPIVVAPFS